MTLKKYEIAILWLLAFFILFSIPIIRVLQDNNTKKKNNKTVAISDLDILWISETELKQIGEIHEIKHYINETVSKDYYIEKDA